jgi:CheY-like chemotaxis protein
MTETAQLLIVDDERPVRRMMHRILEREGYRCQEAGDAAQALSLMNGGGHGFDLAICACRSVASPVSTSPTRSTAPTLTPRS